jgi:hypothetical protein
MPISKHVHDRLRSQISRGEPVLFIGAGFSIEALNVDGLKLPSSKQLTEELWKIAYPGEQYDVSTRLGDAFFAAKQHSSKQTLEYIRSRLSVDARNIPDFYKTWFSMPWARCYSLNIDDLELAITRRHQFQRTIISRSATSGLSQGTSGGNTLEVTHLNGAVWDTLDDMTFSALDYGGRQVTPDPWWTSVVADMMSRPVVFVGTELDESQLWQYVQYRQRKGARGVNELRPGSYLICPELNRARQTILKELNIDWIPMTAKQFEEAVLEQLTAESELGHKELRARLEVERQRGLPQLVSELASKTLSGKTEYLMGAEPTWSDLYAGRAIEREADAEVYKIANTILTTDEPPRPLLITGTAGSGKSTSLMRLGLRLTADSIPAYWIDEQSNIEPNRLYQLMKDKEKEAPLAILIDDADLWGYLISSWARELPKSQPRILFALALRSTKITGLMDPTTLGGIEPYDIVMPHLTNKDIESLIEVLDRENRLGILKGKSHKERIDAFQQEAGRQLLVAMIQATSGKRFEVKAVEEFQELPPLSRQIYAVICLVSSQRFTLDREEILLASGRADNEALNELESLVKRNVVFRYNPLTGYKARHRVISDVVINATEFLAFRGAVLEGVSFAFASRVSPVTPRTNRTWRKLIRFINHEFILQLVSPEDGRRVYDRLESLLSWDHHFWLQRGGLEVQEGDLNLATNFLSQAKSLAPEDGFVKTEWAYLLMKKAARYPTNANARDWFKEGYTDLLERIEERGNIDSYPYHILGSQTLAWVHTAQLSLLEKRELLHDTLEMVNKGKAIHHSSKELDELAEALKSEWLLTAVED